MLQVEGSNVTGRGIKRSGFKFNRSLQARVVELLAGKLLVGHALHHDLDILNITHPNDRQSY
jgi:hypothetical protein